MQLANCDATATWRPVCQGGEGYFDNAVGDKLGKDGHTFTSQGSGVPDDAGTSCVEKFKGTIWRINKKVAPQCLSSRGKDCTFTVTSEISVTCRDANPVHCGAWDW